MTKHEELAVLDAAISKLGPDSYIGPWLLSVRHEAEHSILSDLPPPASWHAHYASQERDRKFTENRAKEIIAEAEKKAAAVAESEKRKLAGIAQHAIRALNAAVDAVERGTP